MPRLLEVGFLVLVLGVTSLAGCGDSGGGDGDDDDDGGSNGALSGLGSGSGGICGRVCECTGCSEQEEAECVDDVEDSEREAADEGCSPEYDAYLSCLGDELECRDSEVDLDGCNDEVQSLGRCLN